MRKKLYLPLHALIHSIMCVIVSPVSGTEAHQSHQGLDNSPLARNTKTPHQPTLTFSAGDEEILWGRLAVFRCVVHGEMSRQNVLVGMHHFPGAHISVKPSEACSNHR